MVPITEDQNVREAFKKLRESYSVAVCTSGVMETGHRSIIVFDTHSNILALVVLEPDEGETREGVLVGLDFCGVVEGLCTAS